MDLEAGFRRIVRLAGAELSNQVASVQVSARAPASATKQPTEMAAAAKAGATWLANTWVGQQKAAGWSAFYADRFNEIITRCTTAPYWRSLETEWDKTAIAYPEVLPFNGTINPAYDDPFRQPTDCRYNAYSRLYDTPTYPSYGADKSPGWAGEVDAGFFKDSWHTTRIIAFTIPTAQRNDTRRPAILHITAAITATATTRGNAIWFTVGTKSRIENSGWTPGVSDKPGAHYKKTWQFTREIPGPSLGGWTHEESIEVWRYGSWRTLERQPTSGQIVIVEIGTPPSLGRYYALNDSVYVLHDDTANVWWPQKPGEI